MALNGHDGVGLYGLGATFVFVIFGFGLAIASHEGYEKTKVMFSGFSCITRMDGE